MALFFVLAANRQASAVNYCPQAFYGLLNNAYMYYCDYCDPMTGCQTCGVAVATMYTCGGDYMCCSGMPDNCIDPIPASALLSVDVARLKSLGAKCCAGATPPESIPEKQGATSTDQPASAPTNAAKTTKSSHIPMLMGVKQRKFLDASEKFVPGDEHVAKDLDVVVRVSEADGHDSFFRLLRVTYKNDDSKRQGTIYFGMEMDPEKAPSDAAVATRKKKGEGDVCEHTITYKDANYEVTSVRVLPDTP